MRIILTKSIDRRLGEARGFARQVMTTIEQNLYSANQTADPHRGPVLDWIDRELLELHPAFKSQRSDLLLALRGIFSEACSRQMVSHFYRILSRLNERHFLLGYRIRQWLSLTYELRISDPLQRVASVTAPLGSLEQGSVALKRHFFEHAEIAIPLNDIRIEIVKKP